MPLTITATYPEWDYKGSDVVAQTAMSLFQSRPEPCRLSPFVFMSDPKLTPNLAAIIERLPQKAAIIYRHFGKSDRLEEAKKLRQITFENQQQLLIGADPDLAIQVGADGVHFKRDKSLTHPKMWRARCPEWIITMAGIKSGHYSADLSILDGLLVSSVFKSQSPSAGLPIGVKAFSNLTKTLDCPVFALGGINTRTAPKLIHSGAYGLAGIRGLTDASD